MLTAETLTDAQIRDALERGIIDANLAVETGARLPGGRWFAPAEVSSNARARVAAILNARSTPSDAGGK